MSILDLPDYTYPVSIIAYEISSLPIDIVALTVGNIGIDIKAQTLPQLNINIAAVAAAVTMNVNITGSVQLNVAITSSVTLNINIASQAVDINIKTSGGANIIIDKLTQTAYTEKAREWKTNRGTTVSWSTSGGVGQAKFFPRGMRGFIETLQIYMKSTDGNAATITADLHVAPCMGRVAGPYTFQTTNTGGVMVAVNPRLQWNYDSMLIHVITVSSNANFGYDTGTPHDGFYSTDESAYYGNQYYRLWIEGYIIGQTVGDVPVSGTLNTIEIPNLSSESVNANVSVPIGTETTIISVAGAGTCDTIVFYVSAATGSGLTRIRVYCDNVEALFDVLMSTFSAWGCTSSTPKFSLLQYGVNSICCVLVSKTFEFRRKFEVKAYNPLGPQTVSVYAYPNLIM